MATPNGLEPSTSSVTGWRANRLHHRAVFLRTWLIISEKPEFVKYQFKLFSPLFLRGAKTIYHASLTMTFPVHSMTASSMMTSPTESTVMEPLRGFLMEST